MQSLGLRARPFTLGAGTVRGVVCIRLHATKLTLVFTGDRDVAHLAEGIEVAVPDRIELSQGLLEVGRVEPADLKIGVPTISGRHAMLRVEADGVTVTDLGSTNGTVVDGEELGGMKSARLPVGGTVVFGDPNLASFRLEAVEDEPAPGA